MAKKMINYLVALVLLVLSANSNAEGIKNQNFNTSNDAVFLQNFGQVTDQNHKPMPNIKAVFNQNNFKLAVKNTGFSLEFAKFNVKGQKKANNSQKGEAEILTSNSVPSIEVETYRIDVDFLNSNGGSKVVFSNPNSTTYNLNSGQGDLSKSINGYKKVVLKDVWNHIDIEFTLGEVNQHNFKYNFILNPGANIKDIQLAYNGVKPSLIGQNLINTCALGQITENIPSVYYVESSSKSEEPKINIGYSLNQNIVSFKSDKAININKTFVIDPNLGWSTYFGGDRLDLVKSVTVDNLKNPTMTGITMSLSSIATSGSFLNHYFGYFDVFVTKFTSSGKIDWSTYFGGFKNDIVASIQSDKHGNVYITGYTNSTQGIASVKAYQTTTDTSDAFLAKFDSKGKLAWSTYFGGSDYDDARSLAVDSAGNAVICGITQSKSGIATSGVSQTTKSTGPDAFIAKFSNDGKLTWATYLGKSGNERGDCVTMDDSSNIYISGLTTSTDLATTGAFKQKISGGSDIFISKINSKGILKWTSYFGGNLFEESTDIQYDNIGNIYLIGTTSSTTNMASNKSFQSTLAGDKDGFITKFNSNGQYKWSSYFGTSDLDQFVSLAIDPYHNPFVIGTTSSTSGLASSGAYLTSNAGQDDAILVKFNQNGSRSYASYFGSSNIDNGAGIVLDSFGSLYIVGNTSGGVGLATGGAYQKSIKGSWDVFLTKFTGFPSLPIPKANDVASCGAKILTLNATNGKSKYKWYHSAYDVNALDSSSSFTKNFINTDTLYVSTLENSVESERGVAVVKINDLPIFSIHKALDKKNNTISFTTVLAKPDSKNSYDVKWTFSDTNGTRNGTTVYRKVTRTTGFNTHVTIKDINGCIDTGSLYLYVTPILNVNNDGANSDLQIFPNPATNQLNIQFNADRFNHPTVIQLIDVMGQVVLERTKLDQIERLNLEDLNLKSGQYILKVTNQQDVYSYKILKQ